MGFGSFRSSRTGPVGPTAFLTSLFTFGRHGLVRFSSSKGHTLALCTRRLVRASHLENKEWLQRLVCLRTSVSFMTGILLVSTVRRPRLLYPFTDRIAHLETNGAERRRDVTG